MSRVEGLSDAKFKKLLRPLAVFFAVSIINRFVHFRPFEVSSFRLLDVRFFLSFPFLLEKLLPLSQKSDLELSALGQSSLTFIARFFSAGGLLITLFQLNSALLSAKVTLPAGKLTPPPSTMAYPHTK